MVALTKYDVFFYISQIEKPERKELIRFLQMNLFFKDVSERSLSKKLTELRKDKSIKGMEINYGNTKSYDLLAFIFWAKMRHINYNMLLESKVCEIYKILFESNSTNIQNITMKTGMSKPTAFKYLKRLTESGFVSAVKKKPLVLKANLNDLSFFYANLFDLSFKEFGKQFGGITIPKIHSKKLIDATVRLHVRSSTVTEGNTATEEDVEKIFGDYPVRLTPREVTEILNTHSAVNNLFSISKENISIYHIKNLHKILMNNLIEKPGEFHYGTKRIMGFKTKFPASKQVIDTCMQALLNFCKKDNNPLILGSVYHFIFVSIHPFVDGNGRMARLLHSWIFLESGYPLFIFNPEKKNEYFKVIEIGRDESMHDFVMFCLHEQKSCLEDIIAKEIE
ncbi:MAG: hypothetical protein GQ477_00920 [Nanohaloarchaea archaeon]|nr:hypothetical protein [Candidatus Nanohaloarchaea archaeon]